VAVEDLVYCEQCNGLNVEPGYEIGLCVSCRDTLVRRPVPGWLLVTSALVLVVVLIALIRVPAALEAGIAMERGRRAEAAKDYSVAVAEYQRIVTRYPKATEARARLGISHFRAGHLSEAVATLDSLSGEKTDDDLADEVNGVIAEIESLVEGSDSGGEDGKPERRKRSSGGSRSGSRKQD
jgi:hypothetical protein